MTILRLSMRLVAANVLAAAMGGCVTADASDTPQAAPTPVVAEKAAAKAAGPRVAAAWQETMQAQLETSKATEALGLFSHGGWSNSGQVLVLLSKDRKVKDVMTVPANRDQKDALTPKRALTAAELKDVEKALKTLPALADVDLEAFDALELEVVHMTKDAQGKASTAKRVFFRDPTGAPHPEHQTVIKALESLKPKGGEK